MPQYDRVIIIIILWKLYVTGFEKSQLPHTFINTYKYNIEKLNTI